MARGHECSYQGRIKIRTEADDRGNILDLTYTLTPRSDIKLSRWAFSGFCLRTTREGTVSFHSPKGIVTLPNPSHLKPESDWPDEKWYASQTQLPNGKTIGGAVFNHPENPATLWHNHRDIRMINPCIVAPREIELKKNVPLVLRYRVIAFDGLVPTDFLNQQASAW